MQQNNVGTRQFAFTLAIYLLALLAGLVWVMRDNAVREQAYRHNQQTLAALAVADGARSVGHYFSEMQRRLKLFTDVRHVELERLAANPDDARALEQLQKELLAYFPDMFATTLASNAGVALSPDFDGLVGEVCQRDLAGFSSKDQEHYQAWLHPHPQGYHFDLMQHWRYQGRPMVLFLSHKTTELVTRLRQQSSDNYRLLLVRQTEPELIEITPEGDRSALGERFRLSSVELEQQLAAVDVPGTRWRILALPAHGYMQGWQQLRAENRQRVVVLALLGGVSLLLLLVFERARQRVARRFAEERQFSDSLMQLENLLLAVRDEQGRIIWVNAALQNRLAQLPESSRHPRLRECLEHAAGQHKGHTQNGGDVCELLGGFYAWSKRDLVRQGQAVEVWLGMDVSQQQHYLHMQQEFVSLASHELRTPLTAILGGLRLLQNVFGGQLPPQAADLVSLSLRNSERLLTLVNDLLDMGKLEAGKLVLQIEPASLSKLLQDTVAELELYSREMEVQVLVKDQTGGCSLDMDALRIKQVVVNLLSNAIKFTPAGRQVQLLAELPAPGVVRISVHDQGSGVPLEFRERIFGKFAQADSGDVRQKGGTGLGLAISRQLVEMHGGRMGFDSPPGEGATFWFELPLGCKE